MMFHLFNSVYLNLEKSFNQQYDSVVIGPLFSDKKFQNSGVSLSLYKTWDEFVSACLGGEEDGLWPYLYNAKHATNRFNFFVEPEIFLRLQMTYWKNIFSSKDPATGLQIYRFFKEDRAFRAHLPKRMMTEQVKNAYLSLPNFSEEEFRKLWEKIPIVEFLQAIPLSSVSMEYQILDYFANPGSTLEPTVLAKIRHCTWTNWVNEIEILKTDILNAVLDANKLLPDNFLINLEDPTNLVSQIKGNKYLRWIVDELVFPENYKYVEKEYDKEIFKQLYSRFYSLWQVNTEDMSELIELIYAHQYKELLERDVRRGFGSVYSSNRYQDRVNQVLMSWIYKCKRENQIQKLEPFLLRQS